MHFRQTYNQARTRLAVLDCETLAPPSPGGGFPPWPTHRPIVTSILVADQVQYGQWQFAVESVDFHNERSAISRIDELLANRRCITFNGRGFDLPVLVGTACRASMYECRNLTDAWASHRYSGKHIDVADLISNFGAAPRASLEMICQAAGVPVKCNGHGGDVAEMLKSLGLQKVKDYCEEDVASTLILFAMVQALRTNDTAYCASLICDFANWVRDAGLGHLAEFQKLSGNAVLERVRLLHRVEEGLRALDDRATVRCFEEPTSEPVKSHHNT
ncbi:MAG: hypothetical protein M3R07_09495, partial [Gemmatimonadota bacterium]|nr:hypothetical protein [Gemmatimonadota bacterium]